MGMKPEERGSPRGIIKASVKGTFRNDLFFSIAQNISTSGIFFETDKAFAPGDKVACSFVLQHRIDVTGEVVRVVRETADLYHYGVRFLNLDSKARIQIQDLVKSQRRH